MSDALILERLRSVLSYEPSTGIFRWLVTTRNVRAGAVAGHQRSDGYIVIGLDGQHHFAHRLALFYESGEWPTQWVDHKDGQPSNNARENLREVTPTINQQNQRRATAASTTGLLGAHPNNYGYRARIKINGKEVHIGNFPTPELAHAAYIAAKRESHEGGLL